MATKLKKGSKVRWKVGTGETTGTITDKITEPTKVDGKEITATKNKPRYLVKNDNTGNISSHRAKSLSLVAESNNLKPNQKETLQDFTAAVNMTAAEIRQWLKTKESSSVGQKDKKGKIKGRKSGKKIVKILRKEKSNYTKKDFKQMKKVVGYIHRHRAQKPKGDIKETPWRYSLMNWGCDPIKSE